MTGLVKGLVWRVLGKGCPPTKRYRMDLHLSLHPQVPLQKCRAQPAPSLHLALGLGTKGRCITQHWAPRVGQEGGLSPLQGPSFWSLVFLFAPRGPSTWQRKELWNGRVFFLLPWGALNLVSFGAVLRF